MARALGRLPSGCEGAAFCKGEIEMSSIQPPVRTGTRVFRKAHVATLAASVALALVLAPIVGVEIGRAQTPSSSSASLAAMPSMAPLVKMVMPAVVNISVVEGAEDQSAGTDTLPESPQKAPFD